MSQPPSENKNNPAPQPTNKNDDQQTGGENQDQFLDQAPSWDQLPTTAQSYHPEPDGTGYASPQPSAMPSAHHQPQSWHDLYQDADSQASNEAQVQAALASLKATMATYQGAPETQANEELIQQLEEQQPFPPADMAYDATPLDQALQPTQPAQIAHEPIAPEQIAHEPIAPEQGIYEQAPQHTRGTQQEAPIYQTPEAYNQTIQLSQPAPQPEMPPATQAQIQPQQPDRQSKSPSPKKAKKPAKSIINATPFLAEKGLNPIVPKGTIAGNALVLVIAIMSFLAALTVATVSIISDATRDWQAEIGRGATIQIRQLEGIDIEGELAKAVAIARSSQGIGSAKVLSTSQSNALLEPWLGLDLVFDTLPVPRLIELTIEDPSSVDFAKLSERLKTEVQGATLDNHRFWVDRLRSMADTAIIIGFTILFLVLAATVLTVIFATRSAMSGNRETIEVLHFVGASNKFIASEFRSKFFTLGLKGSLAGGIVAIITFLLLQFILQQEDGSAAQDQMQALLGVIELGYSAYIWTFILIILIAVFTAVTTGLTVLNTLKKLH